MNDLRQLLVSDLARKAAEEVRHARAEPEPIDYATFELRVLCHDEVQVDITSPPPRTITGRFSWDRPEVQWWPTRARR